MIKALFTGLEMPYSEANICTLQSVRRQRSAALVELELELPNGVRGDKHQREDTGPSESE